MDLFRMAYYCVGIRQYNHLYELLFSPQIGHSLERHEPYDAPLLRLFRVLMGAGELKNDIHSKINRVNTTFAFVVI